MTTEEDYRRGYAQGYAAAAQDAKSVKVLNFCLVHIMPWRREPNPTRSAPPRFGK